MNVRARSAGAVLFVLAAVSAIPGAARAQNTEDGDNGARTAQHGGSTSGDSIGGQVFGAQSSGRLSVDATNRSADSSVTSGDADASNTSRSVVGHTLTPRGGGGRGIIQIPITVCGVTSPDSTVTGFEFSCSQTTTGVAGAFLTANDQVGSNSLSTTQAANALSGDAIAGQVIGAVNSGTSSIVAANDTAGSDVSTGDADSSNTSSSRVGLDAVGGASVTVVQIPVVICGSAFASSTVVGGSVTCVSTTTVSSAVETTNTQHGGNRALVPQTATATSGDGVAGQVLGAVTSGTSSLDARNTSTDVSVETGDADAVNASNLIVGLTAHGPDSATISQFATSTPFPLPPLPPELSGIAPTQMCGNAASSTVVDVTTTCVLNLNASLLTANDQIGDNRATNPQNASATSGDGVGGQVIGTVTSGVSSVVAANTTRDADVTTGDADAANTTDGRIGPDASGGSGTTFLQPAQQLCGNSVGSVVTGTSVRCVLDSNVTFGAANVQNGDNRAALGQSADATTGDGVAGQVLGLVSAGTASVDASNTSEAVAVTTGDSTSGNGAGFVVGPGAVGATGGTITAADRQICGNTINGAAIGGEVTCVQVTNTFAGSRNVQDGDNRLRQSQSADASSGDAIAGQVTGIVTSAGGTTSVVAVNRSRDMSTGTGDAAQTNSFDGFVGLAAPPPLLDQSP